MKVEVTVLGSLSPISLTVVISAEVKSTLKLCIIGYCDVVNVQPRFNFSEAIIN